MRVNILLVIVLPLENVGDYFVVYYLAISEGRRIFFLAILLPLEKAGE